MNKAISFICLFVECAAILVVFITYSKEYSRHFSSSIQIPNDMQLTLCRDIHIDSEGEDITIEEGSLIIPFAIRNDEKVEFIHDGTDEFLTVSWNDFKELDELKKLKNEAEETRNNNQRTCLICGIIGGVITSVIWYTAGYLLTKFIVRKGKYRLLVIIHLFLIGLIIFVYLLFFPGLASHSL